MHNRRNHAGYTIRTFMPSRGRAGSSLAVYTYARKGYRYIREIGIELPARFHATEARHHSYLFLGHTLAVNDVFIALELLC
jgi:hypothetical protein